MPVPEGRGLVSRSLLRDDAYRALRNAIVDGTLAPGERLNDAELVSWLGVSRTPIREALARLELSGLVQTRPGRFTMVSPVDSREARGAQSVVAAMHELAVREAVPLLGEPELDAMRTWNARFRDALRENRVDDALAADLGCRGHARTGRPRGGPVARRAGAGRHAHVERPVPGRAAGEPGGRRAGRRRRLPRGRGGRLRQPGDPRRARAAQPGAAPGGAAAVLLAARPGLGRPARHDHRAVRRGRRRRRFARRAGQLADPRAAAR